MKKSIIFIGLFLAGFYLRAQNLEGAWKTEFKDDQGNKVVAVSILTNGYIAITWYKKENHDFIRTSGGSYQVKDGLLYETLEFDSGDSSQVGKTLEFTMEVSANTIKILNDNTIWQRIDDGKPGELAGAWLISGRKQDGEISSRDTNLPRKTMKILSGTRFQWIAYNTQTGQFMGTGGGTYTTKDGKYTENIDFFSRDLSRVGSSLVFDFELKEGVWHHSGKSSKGDPLYELWSLRK